VAFLSSASNLAPGDTNTCGSDSRPSSISSDGRFVAFISYASNLVAADTNNDADVFVHDQQTGATTRSSVTSNGSQANSGSARPSISSDGRFVSFDSVASNLVPRDTNGFIDVFVHQEF